MKQAEDAAVQENGRSTSSSAHESSNVVKFQQYREDHDVVRKSSGRASSSTPRNLIVPDLTDIGEAQIPTAPPEERTCVAGSGKKYLQSDGSRSKHRAPKEKVGKRAVTSWSLRGKLRFFCDGKAVCRTTRSTRRTLSHLSLQQTLALVMLLSGMLAEAGTPAPRYNVPIAIGIILLPAATKNGAVEYLQREHHQLYITGLALATAIDFVWLLRPQEGAFNGYFVESIKSFTDVGIVVCTLAKICLIFCSYLELTDTEPPIEEVHEAAPAIVPPSFRLWDKVKFFFPRRTLPRRAQLSIEVLHRVLVLAWIHLVCGMLLLALGLISSAWYSGRTQFRVNPVGIPLYIMLLLKSATTLLTFLTCSHRINYDACLELYGLRTRDPNSRRQKVDGVQVRRLQEPVLAYNSAWLHRVQRAKALDGIAGGYLLLVFYTALRSGQIVGGRGVPTMLACIALVQLVLDVWTPLLILVAARCGTALHALHHRGVPGTDPLFPPQLRWEDSDGDDDSDSDDTDDNDDGSDEDSGSDLSHHSSSSSEETDGTLSERRGGQRRPEKMRESPRDPQLPIVDVDAVEGNETACSAQDIASARDIVAAANSSGKGAWLRHWHEASNRAYLVHSLTGEAVWEIPKNSTSSPASFRALASARNDDDLVNGQLTAETFDRCWNELVDSGGFNCRISRIPDVALLAQHLQEHDFTVVSDGLRRSGAHEQRIVLFYAEASEMNEEPGLMFMGEFAFDSLSLKLRARFRSADPQQIVPFVKRLQLKEIVGSYAPCD